MIALDLGLSVKWGDRNLEATHVEDWGKMCSWHEAVRKINGKDICGQILGPGWRMPTYKEAEELLSNGFQPVDDGCTFFLKVYGRNGRSILLPAANIGVGGLNGQYWTSSLDEDDPSKASQFRFDGRGVYGGCNNKDKLQAIRPVYDPKTL